MRLLAFLAAASIVAGGAGDVSANAFDDCVLENMRGMTSDAAAKSIKVACLWKNSVMLSTDELRGLRIVGGMRENNRAATIRASSPRPTGL